MPQPAQGLDSVPSRTILGHPIGLANLFGVELWERFSFYGMLIILGYYLYYSVGDGGLGLPRATATGIVGAYGGLVYLSTVLGGWLGDRVLGMERTVFYGGVVVMAGHIALAFLPGLSGVAIGLVLVALGSGALKANASSLLGTLYGRGDPRRDGGFTLFYLGVNLGGFIGPLVTGVLQTRWGFHYGFGVAALGMAIGLSQYAAFRGNLGEHARVVPNPLPRNAYAGIAIGVVILGTVVVAAFGLGILRLDDLSEVTTGILVLTSVGYFATMLTSSKVSSEERVRVRAFIPLFIASAVFWSLCLQVFTVLAVYSDERMDWSILGWKAPSSWIGSIEPVWVMMLSPAFALMWTKLGRRAPTTPRKFACGVIGMGVAFLLFLTYAGSSDHSVPALGVVAIMGVFAAAELLLSPIGLSVTTQLAPSAFRSQMMALYFFSVGLGAAMSGVLGRYYSTDHETAYFGFTGGFAVLVGLVVWAVGPRISRLMGEVH